MNNSIDFCASLLFSYFFILDDKRYILPCGIHSVPFGSLVIPVVEATGKCVFEH